MIGFWCYVLIFINRIECFVIDYFIDRYLHHQYFHPHENIFYDIMRTGVRQLIELLRHSEYPHLEAGVVILETLRYQ